MTDLFQNFQGADIDRLVECIKAARAAGLSIDKYTSAGVNDNSGNVWLASEDWTGCVYCSIGFDVQWCYTCMNCGEEYDFDSYAEMIEFETAQYEKHDSECDACATETEAA